MFFSYFGGKRNQANWIYSQIPQKILDNTKTFTEVFSGAFWVYAQNDWSFIDNVVYNDMNIYLTNLMYCSTLPDFLEKIEPLYEKGGLFYFDRNFDKDKDCYDYNYEKFKKNFYKIRKELYENKEGQDINFQLPNYDMAIKYAFLLRHAFSGIPGKKVGFSYSASSYKEGKPLPEPKSQILLRKLKDKTITDKLVNVNFEVLDFEKHIEKWDSPNTIFYVDPPYWNCEKNYFRGDEYFGKAGHKRLADVLSKIKGKFILSYYDFDELHEFYPEDKFYWVTKSFTRATTSIVKSDNIDKKGYELLIMNFEPNTNDDIDKIKSFTDYSKNEEKDDFWN